MTHLPMQLLSINIGAAALLPRPGRMTSPASTKYRWMGPYR
jgi:hypothetical protein